MYIYYNEYISISNGRKDGGVTITDRLTGMIYTRQQLIEGLQNHDLFFIYLTGKYLDLLEEKTKP